MNRSYGSYVKWVAVGLALVVAAGWSVRADAQTPADAKRQLKIWKEIYKTPGMIGTDVKYMRGTLLVTGSVPSEEIRTQLETIAKNQRGVKEVRAGDRVKISEPEPSAGDDVISAKIEKDVQADEDLQKAKAKGALEYAVSQGNVTVKGKVPDYSVALSLIRGIKRIPGVQTINFDDLTY